MWYHKVKGSDIKAKDKVIKSKFKRFDTKII